MESSRFEKYVMETIRRENLKNADYNPRVISDKARAKLKKNIREVGLVQPIVWNRRTGNILSGHQRITVLDALERRCDYSLNVAVVDLDPEVEKAQNVFMNNTLAQGDFDSEKLEDLLKCDDFNLDLSGFDLADKFRLFGDDEMTYENLSEAAEKIRETAKIYDKIAMDNQARDRDNFYLIVIFKDGKSRLEFTSRLCLPDGRYVDGRDLMTKMPIFDEPEAAIGE